MSTQIAKRTEIEPFEGFRSKHTPVISEPGNGGWRYVFRFPNGYGASLIVGGAFAYGGLELAVTQYVGDGPDDFDLCYDTHLTNDVLGHLSGPAEVEDLLDSIKALPSGPIAIRR